MPHYTHLLDESRELRVLVPTLLKLLLQGLTPLNAELKLRVEALDDALNAKLQEYQCEQLEKLMQIQRAPLQSLFEIGDAPETARLTEGLTPQQQCIPDGSAENDGAAAPGASAASSSQELSPEEEMRRARQAAGLVQCEFADGALEGGGR